MIKTIKTMIKTSTTQKCITSCERVNSHNCINIILSHYIMNHDLSIFNHLVLFIYLTYVLIMETLILNVHKILKRVLQNMREI